LYGDAHMAQSENTIAVNVVVEMTTASLEAIVENAKHLASRNEKGHYKIDTADKVGTLISQFLLETGFEKYAKNIDNYT
jgi:hypothetical protein